MSASRQPGSAPGRSAEWCRYSWQNSYEADVSTATHVHTIACSKTATVGSETTQSSSGNAQVVVVTTRSQPKPKYFPTLWSRLCGAVESKSRGSPFDRCGLSESCLRCAHHMSFP